jgi:hypothetical protein
MRRGLRELFFLAIFIAVMTGLILLTAHFLERWMR